MNKMLRQVLMCIFNIAALFYNYQAYQLWGTKRYNPCPLFFWEKSKDAHDGGAAGAALVMDPGRGAVMTKERRTVSYPRLQDSLHWGCPVFVRAVSSNHWLTMRSKMGNWSKYHS